ELIEKLCVSERYATYSSHGALWIMQATFPSRTKYLFQFQPILPLNPHFVGAMTVRASTNEHITNAQNLCIKKTVHHEIQPSHSLAGVYEHT
ncbi:unnamed protein product, partial [Allacma fusca]